MIEENKIENYLEKIYDKRKDLSEKDKELIKKAYDFAEKAHKGQMQGKKPFFIHPATVGYLLAKWKQEGEAICAGLLHDSVEDAGVKLSEIKSKFGEKVAMYVDGMSWSKRKINGKLKKDYEALYKKFTGYIRQDPVLAIIKAGDEMSRSDPKSAKRYMEALKKHGVWEDFQKMINERYRGFWIPFFSEIGFDKVVKKIEKRAQFVKEENIEITLHDYISKKELKGIRDRLGRVDGLC